MTMLCYPPAARAQDAKPLRGVALVIGNGKYQALPPLANPESDARAVEDLLDDLGFETDHSADADRSRLSRDIERFIEDAEGADVAVLYYAGHGIEAGGENFLVPVDADLSALDAADEKLVPLSGLIARLKATVPVAIVMLDACRNNPFPSGAMLSLEKGAPPLAVAASGLGLTRSAVALTGASAPAAIDSLGTVIAFAAEPGRTAEDGPDGGNSPYAAAVIRHLDAIAGEEFGTVMRMVGEEVYLKTSGQQRPWINESLRRRLYFGRTPDAPPGEEGDILHERRSLLVTIAALPDPERRQVEQAAADGGVPMDALFGMLSALGAATPDDPEELEKLLRQQTEKLKTLTSEREALKSADPEIVRLSALVAKAIGDGALTTAQALNERAKARARELDAMLDVNEADLRARRIELAQVYAKSAETYSLAFDYRKAADDYEQAFVQVEKWDNALAWQYKDLALQMLTTLGDNAGDNTALVNAIEAGDRASAIAQDLTDPTHLRVTQVNLGYALSLLGEREPGTERSRQSVSILEIALAATDRGADPLEWARIKNMIAVALANIAERTSEKDDVEKTITAYREALAERTRERDEYGWAQSTNNLGTLLVRIGDSQEGNVALASYQEAVNLFESALEVRTRTAYPASWVRTQSNLAVTLQIIGHKRSDAQMLERSAALLRETIDGRPRQDEPLAWASSQSNLGNTLWRLGILKKDKAILREAETAHRASLEEWTRDRVPLDWAGAQNNLGTVLKQLADLEKTTDEQAAIDLAKQASAAYQLSLTEGTRERVPLAWAQTMVNLGLVTELLNDLEPHPERLVEAAHYYREGLEERRQDRAPTEWAATEQSLAAVLSRIGDTSIGTAEFEEAVMRYRTVLAATGRSDRPAKWADLEYELGRCLLSLGKRNKSRATLDASEAAIRASLRVRTRGKSAENWASSQNALGRVILEIATEHDQPDRTRDAIRAFRAAARGWSGDKSSGSWTIALENVALSTKQLGNFRKDAAILAQAERLYRTAAAWRVQFGKPDEWAETQREVARVLIDRWRLDGDATTLREGVAEYAQLLARYPGDKDTVEWADIANSAAYHMLQAAKLDGDLPAVDKAVAILRQALATHERRGSETDIGNTAESLCDALIEQGTRRKIKAAAGEALALCERSLRLLRANKSDEAAAIAEKTLARARAFSVAP